jgi:hypothetical protein
MTPGTTHTLAMAKIADCHRVELQYVYAPGDRKGRRYVVTVDGWKDRVWYGSGEACREVDRLNRFED